MKKFVSMLMILTMVLSLALFTSCGGGDEKEESITVAVVVADGLGDRSFYDSAKEGLDRLVEECGVTSKVIECNGENFKQQMMNAAEEADIVVPVGWQFYDIETVAPDYPDTKFIWVDNETSKPLENVLCITYAQNEGSFLAGYIAAKTSKTGVVGAVGGMDNATINDFLVGYKQGAKYANKDIKVVTNYAGDFEDPAQGKECATALHSKGADVIFQVAGNTGSGVIEAAKEGKFYAIGVDSDQKWIEPETIICSMKKEVGNSIFDTVKDFVDNGKFEANRTWVADMATGYVQVTYGDKDMPQQVSDELKAEVEGLKDKIVKGEIKVKTTR